jgi:putative N6-adenine-specific DNA methylase
MTSDTDLEIFLSTVPGLEGFLRAEAQEKGFKVTGNDVGGITVKGDWPEVWRANLELRGASRVLLRLGSFRVLHLAKLDKQARKFPWRDTLKPGCSVRVEVTCKKSRIYHDKAAAERFETALKEELSAVISPDADICIKARIIKDVCTVSVDTSGEALHKRGHKEAVNKAPMRENLAALLLRASGYKGDCPVVDPMCGSGTFVIEAAEIASNLRPGRSRNFAFEKFATFDETAWQQLRANSAPLTPDLKFYGHDRDKGAVAMSRQNAKRANIRQLTHFSHQTISELSAPEGPTGIVIINPPYGTRIGDQKKLLPLYQSLGNSLLKGFEGWRVGLVTNNEALAKATDLPFKKKKVAFSHGGIDVKLYIAKPLTGHAE